MQSFTRFIAAFLLLGCIYVHAQSVPCTQWGDAECPRNNCTNSAGVSQACVWDSQKGTCGCPADVVHTCSYYSTYADCVANRCPANNLACRWDDAGRTCNCPPTPTSTTGQTAPDCSIFSSPNECQSNRCPNTDILCKWDSSVNRCGCPTASTTGVPTQYQCYQFTSDRECLANFCPGTDIQCKWDASVQRCNCPSSTSTTAVATTGVPTQHDCPYWTNPNECQSSKCPGTSTLCKWDSSVNRCGCPSTTSTTAVATTGAVQNQCPYWTNPNDCQSNKCPGTDTLCKWDSSVNRCGCPTTTSTTAVATTGAVQHQCYQFTSDRECVANFCPGTDIQCKWDASVQRCNCPSSTSTTGAATTGVPTQNPCPYWTNPNQCQSNNCPGTTTLCKWDSSVSRCLCPTINTSSTTGVPTQNQCPYWTNPNECQSNKCPGTDTLCKWDSSVSRCGCPTTSSTTGVPTQNPCPYWTNPDQCQSNNCPGTTTLCKWDSSVSRCLCPTTTSTTGVPTQNPCPYWTSLDQCQSNKCPGTSTLCKWDSSVNRCGCPTASTTGVSPQNPCYYWTNLDQCQSNICPGTDAFCKWDSSVNRCNCPSIVSTTGSSVQECKLWTSKDTCASHICPGTTNKCQWFDSTQRCDCPVASTTGVVVADCKQWTTKGNCVEHKCPGTSLQCQWFDSSQRCDCPQSATTGVATTGFVAESCRDYRTATECGSKACPEMPTRKCKWDAAAELCGCSATVVTTGFVANPCNSYATEDKCVNNKCPTGDSACKWYTAEKRCDCPEDVEIPCEKYQSKADCAHHTCPYNANAPCRWSQTVTECCVDAPGKDSGPYADYNCTSLVPLGKDRCNQVYQGNVCQWVCSDGETEAVSGTCSCSDECSFITDKGKCVESICPETKERCLWLDSEKCACEDDTQNAASSGKVAFLLTFTALVASIIYF